MNRDNAPNIVIGTRGSQLALYQAHKVKEVLEQKHPGLNAQIRIIQTKGDIILDVALSKIGDKGLFTKELEVELLKGTIDIAVHSLKDLPTTFPEGLTLGGVLERGEFRDALVHIKGKTFSELDQGEVVATSSLRRRAQLLKNHPNLTITDIRGNVNTRLRKMEEGHCTAMIMAAAGLQRLGMEDRISEILDPEIFIPAVSQGAIAMEIRSDDAETLKFTESITHKPTLTAVTAERTFLRMLEGGCQVPIGCYTIMENGRFMIKGFVSSLNADKILLDERSGSLSESVQLARQLAQSLIDRGSKEILEEIRNSQGTD